MNRDEALDIVVAAVSAHRPEEAKAESKRRLYRTLASNLMFGTSLPWQELGDYRETTRTLVANVICDLIQPEGGLARFEFDQKSVRDFVATKKLRTALQGLGPGFQSKKKAHKKGK